MTSTPPPVTTGTPGQTEIPGDGVDEAHNGWADEYGDGEPGADLPAVAGSYYAVSPGTAEGDGWLVAASAGGAATAQPAAVYAWSPGVYGFPFAIFGAVGDDRFALSIAGLDHFVAVTAPASDQGIAVEFYTLPPSAPVGSFDDVDGTDLGTALRTADVDASGNPAVLAADGTNTRLILPPWTSPNSPGRWLAAGADLGDVADLDGDGAMDVSLGDGASAWVAPADVTGDTPIEEVGARISPGGGFPAAGAGRAPGDVDGDGYQDLAVPATGDPDDVGAIWLLSGPFDGDRAATDASATISGSWPGEHCARVVSAYGERVAVGCPGGEVLPGRIALFGFETLSGALTPEDADATWVGGHPGEELGDSMASGVDVTGDERPDVEVLGAALYLVPGVP